MTQTNSPEHHVTTKYTEYTDESGVKAMVYEPENDRAWIQSTFRVVVEQ